MRNAKLVLIATFAVLQVVLAAHLAVAAPVAHGRFNGVTVNGAPDPEYAAGRSETNLLRDSGQRRGCNWLVHNMRHAC